MFIANYFIIIIYPLTARVIGASQVILQLVSSTFPVLHCPLWLAELQACTFPAVLFPTLPRLLPPFTVPCKMALARLDEWETWPYHCSLRLFTMVKRSSCGLIACWTLAQTSLLVTWSKYEMRSILRWQLISMACILLRILFMQVKSPPKFHQEAERSPVNCVDYTKVKHSMDHKANIKLHLQTPFTVL